MERIQDWLLLEEEFLKNCNAAIQANQDKDDSADDERSKVDDLRGTPMSVGNLEEIIDDNHKKNQTQIRTHASI